MGHVHLSAGTQAGRHAVKTQALDALGRVAVVEDARQHSNKQIAIRFTVAPGGTEAASLRLIYAP